MANNSIDFNQTSQDSSHTYFVSSSMSSSKLPQSQTSNSGNQQHQMLARQNLNQEKLNLLRRMLGQKSDSPQSSSTTPSHTSTSISTAGLGSSANDSDSQLDNLFQELATDTSSYYQPFQGISQQMHIPLSHSDNSTTHMQHPLEPQESFPSSFERPQHLRQQQHYIQNSNSVMYHHSHYAYYDDHDFPACTYSDAGYYQSDMPEITDREFPPVTEHPNVTRVKNNAQTTDGSNRPRSKSITNEIMKRAMLINSNSSISQSRRNSSSTPPIATPQRRKYSIPEYHFSLVRGQGKKGQESDYAEPDAESQKKRRWSFKHMMELLKMSLSNSNNNLEGRRRKSYS
jgi:hypothetical protein